MRHHFLLHLLSCLVKHPVLQQSGLFVPKLFFPMKLIFKLIFLLFAALNARETLQFLVVADREGVPALALDCQHVIV